MGGFLIPGLELRVPGCGGTLTSSRWASLTARWLHESQPISNVPVVMGFLHLAGRYRPAGSAFPSRVVVGI